MSESSSTPDEFTIFMMYLTFLQILVIDFFNYSYTEFLFFEIQISQQTDCSDRTPLNLDIGSRKLRNISYNFTSRADFHVNEIGEDEAVFVRDRDLLRSLVWHRGIPVEKLGSVHIFSIDHLSLPSLFIEIELSVHEFVSTDKVDSSASTLRGGLNIGHTFTESPLTYITTKHAENIELSGDNHDTSCFLLVEILCRRIAYGELNEVMMNTNWMTGKELPRSQLSRTVGTSPIVCHEEISRASEWRDVVHPEKAKLDIWRRDGQLKFHSHLKKKEHDMMLSLNSRFIELEKSRNDEYRRVMDETQKIEERLRRMILDLESREIRIRVGEESSSIKSDDHKSVLKDMKTKLDKARKVTMTEKLRADNFSNENQKLRSQNYKLESRLASQNSRDYHKNREETPSNSRTIHGMGIGSDSSSQKNIHDIRSDLALLTQELKRERETLKLVSKSRDYFRNVVMKLCRRRGERNPKFTIDDDIKGISSPDSSRKKTEPDHCIEPGKHLTNVHRQTDSHDTRLERLREQHYSLVTDGYTDSDPVMKATLEQMRLAEDIVRTA